MRFLFLLIFLAGAALGVGYPWAASSVTGYEIGTWRVFEHGDGFTPVEVNIATAEAPVAITVDVTAEGALNRVEGKAVLFMDVTGTGGEPVLSAPLDLVGAEARTVNPQSGETAYRVEAERLSIIGLDRYRFAFRAGDGAEDRLVSVDLTLEAGAFDLDPRAVPAGFIMMAVGLVGFVASLFRKRRENPNSKPPPRWGRGK